MSNFPADGADHPVKVSVGNAEDGSMTEPEFSSATRFSADPSPNSMANHGTTAPSEESAIHKTSRWQGYTATLDSLSVLTGLVIGACSLVLFWKLGAFKLPSQIALEKAAAAKKPAPSTGLLRSILDWITPWRWGRGDMLKPSTPTGGDMGAHVWTPDFIKRSLIPKGRLTGWSDDWFGGIPVINFYFPLPMLLIVALSYILPYGVAFKLVTVLGVVSLPITAWKCGKLSGLRRPIPLFFGLAGTAFVLSRNFDLPIYGGNIKSTMAGEFSFSISLSMAMLFLGFFTRSLRTGQYRGRTALILAVTGLCHLLPTIFAMVVAFFILITHLNSDRIRPKRLDVVLGGLGTALGIGLLVAVVDTKPHGFFAFGALLFALVLLDWFTGFIGLGQLRDAMLMLGFGGAMTGFWLVPFYGNLAYTNDMGWEKMEKYIPNLFPFWAGRDANGKGLVPYPDSGIVAVAMILGAIGAIAAFVSLLRGLNSLAGKRASGISGDGRRAGERTAGGVDEAASSSVLPIAVIVASFVGLGISWLSNPLFGLLAAVITVGVLYAGWAALGDRSDIGAFTVVGALVLGVLSLVLLKFPESNGAALERAQMRVGLIVILCVTVIVARVALGGADFDRWPIVLVLTIGLIAILFRFSPQFRLWNARALPFWFLSHNLLAAYGVAQIPKAIRALISKYAQPRAEIPHGKVLGAGFVSTAVFVGLGLPLNLVPGNLPVPDVKGGRIGVQLAKDSTANNDSPGWALYNFAGYEARNFAEYKAFMDEAGRVGKEHGCGRAIYEYEDAKLNSYGTALALMLMPYWTKGCIGSLEGVYFESSATAPYHWLTAAHITAPRVDNADGTKKYSGPSNPQRFLRYPQVTEKNYPEIFKTGIKKLQAGGIRYYVAITDLSTNLANQHPDLQRVGGNGPFNMYLIADSARVAPLAFEPVVVTGIDQDQEGGWLDVEQEWYYNTADAYPSYIAWDGPKSWQRSKATISKPKNEKNFGVGVSLQPTTPRPLPPVAVTNIKHDNVNISFSVDKVGVPVVVRTSFYTNWEVKGAKGPYRIMPNYMVVIPTTKNVRLNYGYSIFDKLGYFATITGLLGAVLLHLTRKRDSARDDAAQQAALSKAAAHPTSDVATNSIDEDSASDPVVDSWEKPTALTIVDKNVEVNEDENFDSVPRVNGAIDDASSSDTRPNHGALLTSATAKATATIVPAHRPAEAIPAHRPSEAIPAHRPSEAIPAHRPSEAIPAHRPSEADDALPEDEAT